MRSRSTAGPERPHAFISCVIDERAHHAPKLPTHKLSSVALRWGCSPPWLGGEDPVPQHGKGDEGAVVCPERCHRSLAQHHHGVTDLTALRGRGG